MSRNDVAIIGVGLHPFGRFEGKSAMQMAGDAIQLALSDAGIGWKDVQFAVGGSWTVANPDALVGMVGLTGIPFTDVFNACATAASATKLCADSIRLGDYDIGIAVGMDKHPRGAFTEDPALVGMPSWYAQNGQYLYLMDVSSVTLGEESDLFNSIGAWNAINLNGGGSAMLDVSNGNGGVTELNHTTEKYVGPNLGIYAAPLQPVPLPPFGVGTGPYDTTKDGIASGL